MREIIITGGLIAQVDDEDFPRLSPHTWYAKRVYNTWHAFRYLGKPGTSKRVSMHHEIIGCVPYQQVYHQDGNGLNNQKANLVPRKAFKYRQRVKEGGPTTSQYRGVAWVASRSMWLAYIADNGKTRHLGLHEREEDAARHYDAAAKRKYGKDAILNFPGEE